MSSFGQRFRVHLWGESHGPAVGVLIEGCPAGIPFNQAYIQHQLDRRKPGQSKVTTQRKETDALVVLSGVHEGHTTGAPILLQSSNQDVDSKPYAKKPPRPGHSDLAAHLAFFGHNDPRGGGHFGGRLTWGLVAAGAVARLGLRTVGAECLAYTERIHDLAMDEAPAFDVARDQVDRNAVRCPDHALAKRMEERILDVRKEGDSVGGVVRCRIRGLPAGLGGYHFASFESRMSQLLLGIPAVKGVEFGQGFRLASMKGSQANDAIGLVEGRPRTLTNKQGGTVGGFTDGNEVDFAVAFKPTSSLPTAQDTVDLETLEPATVQTYGRHDPCIVPRAVVVVENAAAVLALDFLLERLAYSAFEEASE